MERGARSAQRKRPYRGKTASSCESKPSTVPAKEPALCFSPQVPISIISLEQGRLIAQRILSISIVVVFDPQSSDGVKVGRWNRSQEIVNVNLTVPFSFHSSLVASVTTSPGTQRQYPRELQESTYLYRWYEILLRDRIERLEATTRG